MIIKYKPLTKTERETIVKSAMRGRERERKIKGKITKLIRMNW